jgi:hypothetical protein
MFRPILRHIQVNILHEIEYSFIRNLHVHKLKSQTVLKSNVRYMSSRDFPLQEERQAFPAITGTGNKECVTPIAGRIRQNFAGSFVRRTGTSDYLC